MHLLFLLQNVAVFLSKLTRQQPSQEGSKPNTAAERNSAFFFFSDTGKRKTNKHLYASHIENHVWLKLSISKPMDHIKTGCIEFYF